MNYKALQQQAAAAIVQSWSLKIKLIEHDPQDQDQYMILEPSCVAEDENGTICLRGIVRQCVINVVGGCNNFPIANIVSLELTDSLFNPDPHCANLPLGWKRIFPPSSASLVQ